MIIDEMEMVKEIGDKLLECAKKEFNRGNNIAPLFFLIKDDNIGAIPGMFETMPKEEFYSVLHDLCKGEDIDYVILISESWLSRRKGKDKTINMNNNISPSEDPNREECIMMNIMSKYGESTGRMIRIERDNDNTTLYDEGWFNDIISFRLKPWGHIDKTKLH